MARVRTSARQSRLLDMKAEVFKALGHPIRLAIVEALREGPVCVCELARRVGAERSNVSRHLAVLTGAGILTASKRGLMVHYALCTPCITEFFACVEKVLRQQLIDGNGLLRCLRRAPRRTKRA